VRRIEVKLAGTLRIRWSAPPGLNDRVIQWLNTRNPMTRYPS
jgi:hypothetical protein